MLAAAHAVASEELSITEIPYSRVLPHAFHGQALASIAGIYPDGQVLEAERLAYLGDYIYALVAYRKEANAPEAHLDVIAVSGQRAWRLQGTCPMDELARMKRAVLKRIGQLR